ncbi:glycosyltransferase family 2 protein [Haladaptatus sp. CMAA 1911]|uniref:glycosyltransferase family 2 protein n=1 Tax=unclassified Haladaptatus TaxID=2622732 RepID=UPI003754DE62
MIFWASIFGIVHTYLLYPLLLVPFRNRRTNIQEPTKWPSTTLVIAAYNEEDVIKEKIENSLQLEYPDEQLDIIVFSDASSDRTDEIVRSYSDAGVRLMRIEGRVGKTKCQNQVVSNVDTDFTVFSDANSMYEPDAIQKLIVQFSDDVGCVVGELRYRDDSDIEGESFYWKYEQFIKKLESRFNSLVTGNGSIYATRTSSYVPLPRDAISDFAEPLAIVQSGKLVKYAPDAVTWENTGNSVDSELSRRIRIVTRSWNTVAEYRGLLNPIHHPIFSFQLFSHKVLRWLSPLLLIGAFTSNVFLVALSSATFWVVLLSIQFGCYFLAILGWTTDQIDRSVPGIVHIPYYFTSANYGMLVGFWNFLRGRNIVTWETASRDMD